MVGVADSPAPGILVRVMARRLVQLFLGLLLYGFSMALLIRARLGLDPWDAFHQGVSRHVGWSFGTTSIVTGALVLLLWIPLRQRPGLGTLSNVVVIGVAVDASLAVLPEPGALGVRTTLLVGGIGLNALAGALYIGARLGPGPRDGLMTGLADRTGWSIRRVRTGIEVTVLAVGWVLGGSVGLGTVLYALAIGPLVQVLLARLTVPERAPGTGVEQRRGGPLGSTRLRPVRSAWRSRKVDPGREALRRGGTPPRSAASTTKGASVTPRRPTDDRDPA